MAGRSNLLPALAGLSLGVAAWGQSFQMIPLRPGTGGSDAFGVSVAGDVVVGASYVANPHSWGPGWIWTPQGGRQDLVGAPFQQPNTSAYGISGDGNVVVGITGPSSRTSATSGYRYNRTTGVLDIIPVNSSFYNSIQALAASQDGSVVVGAKRRTIGFFSAQPFYWTPATGTVAMGFVRPEHNSGHALGVSADGLKIVGTSDGGGTGDAFLWTVATGMSALPHLVAGGISSAFGINSGGNIVVGSSYGSDGLDHGVMWVDGAVVDLGVPSGFVRASGKDASLDGSVVVGYIQGQAGLLTAALWTQPTGWVRLQDYLTTIGVHVPPGINLGDAVGISDDGRTIVGRNGVPSDVYQGWVVTIPSPGVLVPMGFLSLVSYRRRSRPA